MDENKQMHESQTDKSEHDAQMGMYMTFKSGNEYFGLRRKAASQAAAL